ncbi:hypothetical protein HYT58_00190 [Candidatus Woesearchaeota archaeon]|nr:hypothetical protein [Candidatus Woesearchaeota archaeon]
MKLSDVLIDLHKVKGLRNFKVIREEDKNLIRDAEDINNLGVRDCLNRRYTILLTHDSTFREPTGKIVEENNGQAVFPAVSFPEVRAKDVVSSSPSDKVHKILVEKFNIKLNEGEATLLIGFNL